MVDVRPMVDDAISESREWFSRIDRKRLGSFAYELEPIILRNAYMSMRLNRFRNLDVLIEVGRRFDELEFEFYHSYDMVDKESARRSAEVCLWWDISGDQELIDKATKFLDSLTQWGEDKSVLDWFSRYRMVYQNPHFADYYSAGIYDNVLVRKFIADGIDSAVAKELMAEQ